MDRGSLHDFWFPGQELTMTMTGNNKYLAACLCAVLGSIAWSRGDFDVCDLITASFHLSCFAISTKVFCELIDISHKSLPGGLMAQQN